MKKVGDKIEWNTKAGVETGVIIGVKTQVQYTARIIRNGMHMHFLEEPDQNPEIGPDANHEFIQLVQEMRRLQCLYFDTKDWTVLIESKRLEKKVDAIIEIFQAPNLFNEHQDNNENNEGTELRTNY